MIRFRHAVHSVVSVGAVVLLCAWTAPHVAGQGRGAAESPASKRPPQLSRRRPIRRSRSRPARRASSAQCGFCHGRDAGGQRERARSHPLVASRRGRSRRQDWSADSRGASRQGNAGIQSRADADIAAIVAFIHDAKTKAETAGRRTARVDVEDLQTGNADAGRRYFNGAGGCAKCHSLSGDFAKVGARSSGACPVAAPALSRLGPRGRACACAASGDDSDDARRPGRHRQAGVS